MSVLNFPNKCYKRWVTLQRINELEKAIKREWSQKRQEELDELKGYLDELNAKS